MDDPQHPAQTPDAPPASQWCLVGNVVWERPSGEGGKVFVHGTKHFAAGAKVYCLPVQWSGYENIIVIGRHSGSHRFITLIMCSSYIENWRAKVVYNPEVLRRIHEATREPWSRNWESQELVETYVAFLTEHQQAARAVPPRGG